MADNSEKPRKFALCWLLGKKHTKLNPVELTLDQVEKMLHKSAAECHKKDGLAIIGASFTTPKRAAKNVKEIHWLNMDVDSGVQDVDEFLALFPYAGFVYTTWNHSVPEYPDPRFRLMLPLKRPVTPTEYPILWEWARSHSGNRIDRNCKDAARLMYTPRSKNPEATCDPWIRRLEGPLLDPDDLPGGVCVSKPEYLPTEAVDAELQSDRSDAPDLQREKTDALEEGEKIPRKPQGQRKLRKYTSKDANDKYIEHRLKYLKIDIPIRKDHRHNSLLKLAGSLREDDEDKDRVATSLKRVYELWCEKEPPKTEGELADIVDYVYNQPSTDDILAEAECQLSVERAEAEPIVDEEMIEEEETDKEEDEENDSPTATDVTVAPTAAVSLAKPGDMNAILEAKPNNLRIVRITDDNAAAKLFLRVYGEIVRYCPELDMFLFWDGRRWLKDVRKIWAETAMKILGAYLEMAAYAQYPDNHKKRTMLLKGTRRLRNHSTIRSALKLARLSNVVYLKNLDVDPWLLTTLSGTIDIKTRILRPHDPKDLITCLAPVEYDADAPRPEKFLGFLNRATSNDQKLVGYLQRIGGYATTGLTGAREVYFFYGKGDTGKSKVIEVQSTVLGQDYAATCNADIFMEDKRGVHLDSIARLDGPRLIGVSEVNTASMLDEGSLKRFASGGDMLEGHHMFKSSFEFKPVGKLWFAFNHLPRIRRGGSSIWNRVHVIPFNNQIPKKEQDWELVETMRDEFPGILKWMVEGAPTSGANYDFKPPPCVVRASANYRDVADNIGAFIDERLIKDPDAKERIAVLYLEYKDWCEDSGTLPLSKRHFGEELAQRGYDRVDIGHYKHRGYAGLRLKPPPKGLEETMRNRS